MDGTQSQLEGENLLSPIILSSKQEDICKRLDDWHGKYGLKIKPSDMFKGALFAARTECRSNPDWLAQATNSLREILYPFWSKHVDGIADRKVEALKKYGSVKVGNSFEQEIGRVYGNLNELAHHGNVSVNNNFLSFKPADFEKLLEDFEKIMDVALSRQIDVHKEIDSIILINPKNMEIEK